jgi:hypothetical protein
MEAAGSLFKVLVYLVDSGTMGVDVSLNSYPTESLVLEECSSHNLSPSLRGSVAPLLILMSFI